MSEELDNLKEKLTKRTKECVVSPKDMLSTGSTLLNLALSNNPRGGIPKGKYTYLVGDSKSGKTIMAMTILAEASINKEFEEYALIYDNSEDGMLMDVGFMFGEKLSKKLKPPRGSVKEPIHSTTVEEFYFHLDDALKSEKPCIYILDSMDGLETQESEEKFSKNKKLHDANKEELGSYGTAKAKLNSTNLPRVVHALRETQSILIIVSQTRDKLGFGFEKKTRSGGKALRFYAHLELWTSIKREEKKKVKGEDIRIGTIMKVSVEKNRLTGKERSVYVPIYDQVGIDDIGSMVDFLIEHGVWGKGKSGFIENTLGIKGRRDGIIEAVESTNLETELKTIVTKTWQEIESECEVKRKKKY